MMCCRPLSVPPSVPGTFHPGAPTDHDRYRVPSPCTGATGDFRRKSYADASSVSPTSLFGQVRPRLGGDDGAGCLGTVSYSPAAPKT
jgi:hypothetical protein